MTETVNIDPTLLAFCDQHERSLRFYMKEPWVKDGYIWATDSIIAVRIKTDEPDSEAHSKRPPCEQLVQWSAFPIVDGFPAPVAEVKWAACSTCGGEKKYPCPHCEQLMPCYNCDQTGEEVESTDVAIGEELFDAYQLSRVNKLGKVTCKMTQDKDGKAVLAFQIGPYEGLLMSLDKSKRKPVSQ